ncbi:MAG: tripartite tricarboxylate transporter TctB family protein [Tagaea sp.]|nr:tripartite tricarboxylate transporter TctB family protein [Tagaea sp.]
MNQAPKSAEGTTRLLAQAGVALLMTLAAGLVYAHSHRIRPSPFDPLGSAAVPRMLAIIVAVLAVAVLIDTVLRLRRQGAGRAMSAPTATHRRPWRAVGTYLAVVAYVATIHAGIVSFTLASVVFLALSGAVMVGFRRPALLGIAVAAVVLGLPAGWLFEVFLAVDFPASR